jgi:hypothetical protein
MPTPMPSQFAPLPTRTMSLDGPCAWPYPPFGTARDWELDDSDPQPCRIETLRGFEVDGQMLAFDLERRSLIFRFDDEGGPLRVHFARFRRITLLKPLPTHSGVSQQPNTFSPRLRKYQVALNGDARLDGRTAGHVETPAGLFLFTPDAHDRALQRVFVPTAAYTRCVLGPSVHEEAAIHWHATPQALLAAIEQQPLRKVLPIGQAMFNLGLLSARQLAGFLKLQSEERSTPIGEMLVMAGVISRADLRTALVHKMGYPLVDLSRFPADGAALRELTMDAMLETNALPLLKHAGQLIIAVDNLACTARLQDLVGRQLRVVPVLALKGHIESALVTMLHDGDASFWRYEEAPAWSNTEVMLHD